jgi:beta-glucosidase
VPINVGDPDYEPLYPFGWGLRTDSARSRLRSAMARLGDSRRDPAVRAAVWHLQRGLFPHNWHRDGSVKHRSRVLGHLGEALTALDRSSVIAADLQEVIVSVARDIAQTAAIAGTASANWARLIADADHALLIDDPVRAFALLRRAAGPD